MVVIHSPNYFYYNFYHYRTNENEYKNAGHIYNNYYFVVVVVYSFLFISYFF